MNSIVEMTRSKCFDRVITDSYLWNYRKVKQLTPPEIKSILNSGLQSDTLMLDQHLLNYLFQHSNTDGCYWIPGSLFGTNVCQLELGRSWLVLWNFKWIHGNLVSNFDPVICNFVAHKSLIFVVIEHSKSVFPLVWNSIFLTKSIMTCQHRVSQILPNTYAHLTCCIVHVSQTGFNLC